MGPLGPPPQGEKVVFQDIFFKGGNGGFVDPLKLSRIFAKKGSQGPNRAPLTALATDGCLEHQIILFHCGLWGISENMGAPNRIPDDVKLNANLSKYIKNKHKKYIEK